MVNVNQINMEVSNMDHLESVNLLRGSLTIEELQQLILLTIKDKEINKGYKNIKELTTFLSKLNKDELITLYFNLGHSYGKPTVQNQFNESIENLSLEIFSQYSNAKSFLDIGSGTGHMLYKSAKLDNYSSLSGEEINPENAKVSKTILESLNKNIEVNNIDSSFGFNNKNKYDSIFVDALFMNSNKDGMQQIAKNAGDTFISTRGNIFEWVFVNRILNNISESGIGTILIRNNALLSDSDKSIRKYLVDNGLIKAIVQLPNNLLNGTSISTTMLIISKNNNYISFIDASEIYTPINRFQRIFNEKNIKEISSLINTDTEKSRNVTKEEISEKDYVLTPKRYTNSIDDQLQNPKSLTTFVDIIRGKDISKNRLDQDKNYKKSGYLINLSDINEYDISLPKQMISQDLLDEYKKYTVKPMDIIITARGSDYKLGLVNKSFSEKNMIVSSNLNILRIKSSSNIDPFYLFAFLASNIAKEQFEVLSTGNVIKVFSIKSLNNFMVPVLSDERMIDIAKEMEEKFIDYHSHLKKVKSFRTNFPVLFEKSMED